MIARLSLALVTSIALMSGLSAQDARERIARGKQATAYVDVEDNKSSATAVCISAEGVFVTNEHVISKLPAGKTMKLIVDAGSETPREYSVEVLRTNKDHDLAILKVVGGQGPFVFLPLGDESALYETMSVTAFGYPFGKQLAVNRAEYPEISVNVGRITSLRKREGKLDQIQLDASLNPGNSGGPIVDETGNIVGIVRSGVQGAGVNFAIPISRVKSLVEKPLITFDPPVIAQDKKHEELELQFTVVPFLRPLDDATIAIELTTDGGKPRTFTADRQADNRYLAKVVPLPDTGEITVWLNSSLTYSGGSVTGRVRDQEIRIGDESVKLSNIRSIQNGETTQLTTNAGAQLSGTLDPTLSLAIDLGETELPVLLSKIKRLELNKPNLPEPRLDYAIVVRAGDQVLARQEGALRLSSLAGKAFPTATVMQAPSSFKAYDKENQRIDLPDTVTDVTLAAGGRLILYQLAKTRKVAVYDVNEGRITKYLSLSSDDARIAASQDKLIVVNPSDGVIERWSLVSFERELTKATPAAGTVSVLAMGYASNGPLLLSMSSSGDGPPRGGKSSFFDLATLEPLDAKIVGGRAISRDRARASATGDVFGMWSLNVSPTGLEILVLYDKEAKGRYEHTSAGHVIPNYDGSLIFTGSGGVFTNELNAKGAGNNQFRDLIPTTHPRYYIGFPQAGPGNPRNAPAPGTRPVLFTTTNNARVVDLPDPELNPPTGPANRNETNRELTMEKRVIFIHQAGQVVSLPFTNDRLLVKRFDLREALEQAGIDYLYVQSAAPRMFQTGEAFSYKIDVASRKGTVEFKLESGPTGMTVDADGLVRWAVPSGFADKQVSAIISIRDASGQSLFETLTLSRSGEPDGNPPTTKF